jgi:hypothetical protein
VALAKGGAKRSSILPGPTGQTQHRNERDHVADSGRRGKRVAGNVLGVAGFGPGTEPRPRRPLR